MLVFVLIMVVKITQKNGAKKIQIEKLQKNFNPKNLRTLSQSYLYSRQTQARE